MPSRLRTNQAKLMAFVAELLQSLEWELLHLEFGRRPARQMKEVYDAVYLPIAKALADGITTSAAEAAILHFPLWEDLASTQVRIVLEIL
jgi:hypothetical protein